MSRNYRPGQSITVTAAAAISGNRFIAASGNYPTVGHKALGATMFNSDSGEDITVIISGTACLTAGGAIAQDAEVEIAASGKAITLAAGKSAGLAMEAASADGDLIEVRLF